MKSIELQARRESLAEAMLHIESEELITKIEKLLKHLRSASSSVSPRPRCWEDMTPADWDERFALCEAAIAKGDYLTGKDAEKFINDL